MLSQAYFHFIKSIIKIGRSYTVPTLQMKKCKEFPFSFSSVAGGVDQMTTDYTSGL